jgi:hypothetical protein
MGKIILRGMTSAINDVLEEVNILLEPRDYNLTSYFIGNSISFIRVGMIRTVQLRSHSGHRVMVTLNLPSMELKIPFDKPTGLKEAAIYIADSFLPRILTLPERDAIYEERCERMEQEAIKNEVMYPHVMRLLRMPGETNDDRHKALDFRGVPRFGQEINTQEV